MTQSSEAFKERIREVAGQAYWTPTPTLVSFQQEYMSRAGAIVFSLEHCQMTDKFPRWFGNVIANCDQIQARAYMIENMFVEEVKDPTMELGHNESMQAFAKALGVSQQGIDEYEPLITTTMALNYFDDISRTKPWLEAFAAVGVLELVTNAALAARYGQVPLNSRAPWAKLGLEVEALAHWAAAEAADHGTGDSGAGHGEDALAILAKFATTKEQQDRCAKALREAVLVHKFQYDQVGLKAIEATVRSKKDAAKR